MRVYWLTQAEGDVPLKNDWLCAAEIVCLNRFRFPKRRADWRLGRWTAKQAIAACLHWPTEDRVLAEIEIRATSSGAPGVLLPGLTTPLSFSISHRAGKAMCAVSPVRMRLGCDLEIVEPRSQAFAIDYFTSEEQSLVERAARDDRSALLTLLWSAKESALKALGQGLRLDTRSITVTVTGGRADISGWSPLEVHCADKQIFQGWWRRTDGFVHTLVSDPACESPIELRASGGGRSRPGMIDLHDASDFEEEHPVKLAS
jgi:4'-phosphopantetheinyl transferase